jgi:hypothetical protein
MPRAWPQGYSRRRSGRQQKAGVRSSLNRQGRGSAHRRSTQRVEFTMNSFLKATDLTEQAAGLTGQPQSTRPFEPVPGSRGSRPLLRLSLLALACAATGPALANQSLMGAGAGLTLGPVYNRANIGSSAYNPANVNRLVAPDETIRLGVFDAGARYEVGTLDDLKGVTDQVRADIDNARLVGTQAAAEAALNRLNSVHLPTLAAGARLSAQGRASLLAPVLIRSDTLRGTFALAADVQMQGSGRFRRSDAVLVNPTPTNLKFGVTSASAFDVKLARVTHASLAYGADITSWLPASARTPTSSGQLDIGLRLNSYRARLERQIVGFVDAAGNTSDIKLGDRSNRSSASASALDVGLMWGDEHYQIGATIYNIGSPKLRYPDPTTDLNQANRDAALKLLAEGTISQLDAVALKPHMVLEASVFSANRRWLMQSSVATNETPDFVGEAHRYGTLAVAYNADRYEGDFATLLNYLMPSVRLGVRRNMVGSRLSLTSLGVSWGVFNLDVSASQKSVNVDGSKAPRAAGISLSVAEKY